MADPEFIPAQPPSVEAPFPLIEGIADPLGLATQALAKLQTHGLSGLVEVTGIEDGNSQIILFPEQAVARPPENVVSLDLHRLRRQSGDTPEDHSLTYSVHEDAALEGIVEELAESGLGFIPASARTSKPERKSEIKQQIRLSPAARLALIKRAQEGEESAMERLCLHTVPLVMKLAGKIGVKLSFDEKYQAGLSALPRAVLRYDPTVGANWYTFAAHRIIGAILDAARDELPIAKSADNRLKEIAKINDPEERQQLIHDWATHKNENERLAGVTSLINEDGSLQLNAVSIDGLFRHTEDPDADPYSVLETATSSDPYEEVAQKAHRQELQSLIMQLPENQQIVLTNYYDVLGKASPEDGTTLKAIGAKLGVSESRACQLHTTALGNLRILLRGGEIPVPKKKHRLEALNTRAPSENPLRFLERVYNSIAEYESAELSEEEAATVIESLPPDWKHRNVILQGKRYTLLQLPLRQAPPNVDLKDYQTETNRRKVGWRGSTLTILADGVTVSDLRLIMETQKRFKNTDAFPVNDELLSKFKGAEKELEIIAAMYIPNGQLALQFNIERSTVRTHIYNAMQRIDTNSAAHLAVIAAFGGLIPLNKVPADQTKKLTDREIEVLRDHYALSYEEGAQKMLIARNTFRVHWHSILSKTGAFTQVQAVLMAIKDDLIITPDLPDDRRPRA
jgi:RNA polymerase sigma factor for flagellar operon FliA